MLFKLHAFTLLKCVLSLVGMLRLLGKSGMLAFKATTQEKGTERCVGVC